MSFHLCTYQATVNSTTLVQLNALAGDPVLTIQNNSIVAPSNGQILFGFAQGGTIKQAEISTPSLQAKFLPNIYPVSLGIVNTYEPSVADFTASTIPVVQGDAIEITVANGGSEATYGALGITFDGSMASAQQGTQILHATGSTACTANQYTTIALTFDASLPSGNYAVVGASAASANMIFFRIIFTGQAWRPGGVACSKLQYRPHILFRRPGLLPVWGTFNALSMPRLEVMCSAADISQDLFLHIVKTG